MGKGNNFKSGSFSISRGSGDVKFGKQMIGGASSSSIGFKVTLGGLGGKWLTNGDSRYETLGRTGI